MTLQALEAVEAVQNETAQVQPANEASAQPTARLTSPSKKLPSSLQARTPLDFARTLQALQDQFSQLVHKIASPQPQIGTIASNSKAWRIPEERSKALRPNVCLLLYMT